MPFRLLLTIEDAQTLLKYLPNPKERLDLSTEDRKTLYRFRGLVRSQSAEAARLAAQQNLNPKE